MVKAYFCAFAILNDENTFQDIPGLYGNSVEAAVPSWKSQKLLVYTW